MFKNKRLSLITIIIAFTIIAGCKGRYERILTGNDTPKKYQEALRLYNDEKYTKALPLFDDLMGRYKGRSEAEDLTYYQAYTNYKLNDYTTARYQFKVFSDTYPSSAKSEECRYMSAYCYYLESPKFSLDQQNTLKAIETLQLFINIYPTSERAAEAGKLIDDLRNKLESKAYNNAKLYYVTGAYDAQNYRSAVIAFKNALRDYPDTKYAEEMEYLCIKAQYLFAQASLEIRQEERFGEVVSLYNDFTENYPKSEYTTELDRVKADAEKGITDVKKLLAAEIPVKQDSTTTLQK